MVDRSDAHVLYSGPDLDQAVELTPLPSETPSAGLSTQWGWSAAKWNASAALRHLHGMAKGAFNDPVFEIRGSGRTSSSGADIEVRYLGDRNNFQFLIDACFDTFDLNDEIVLSLPKALSSIRRSQEDILLIDSQSPLLRPPAPALSVPPWLKQRVNVPSQWKDFIAALPRGTRKEVGRYLRKYRYEARVTADDTAFVDFYRDLYEPHVRRRFREQAFVMDETSFHRNRSGACLIELIHDGEVVAANVVRVAGNSLWILWCGFSRSVETRRLKGATDVLDYFSALYAARRGVQVIDFGRARPMLNDGALAYKSKWKPRLQIGILKRPPLHIVTRRLDGPVADVIGRNIWITRRRQQLIANVLFTHGPASDVDVREVLLRCRTPGIEIIRFCSLQGFDSDLQHGAWLDSGVELINLRATATPFARFVAS
jgi:hypothetical protein